MRSTAQQCRLGLFQDSDFARDHEDSKSTSGGMLYHFRSRTFVPMVECARNRLQFQTALQKLRLSFDARLRMDGIPVLDLWDSVIDVFHSSPNPTKPKHVTKPRRNLSATIQPNLRKQISTKHTDLDLTNIDHVPSKRNAFWSQCFVYVFEDNESVMTIILKCRSPTMRHVSRTDRIALDWFFNRFNFDSQIQIRYIDIKHHFVDILTKGNCTHDE